MQAIQITHTIATRLVIRAAEVIENTQVIEVTLAMEGTRS